MDAKLGHATRASDAQTAQIVKVVLSKNAGADIKRLRTFLAQKDTRAAEAAIAILIDAVESLGSLTERGRPVGFASVRELIVPFGRSAYVLRYFRSQRRQAIVVLRIWHGREVRE
jgi:plasmid stabilization system protein ParE